MHMNMDPNSSPWFTSSDAPPASYPTMQQPQHGGYGGGGGNHMGYSQPSSAPPAMPTGNMGGSADYGDDEDYENEPPLLEGACLLRSVNRLYRRGRSCAPE
jgi:hypothetical protein